LDEFIPRILSTVRCQPRYSVRPWMHFRVL